MNKNKCADKKQGIESESDVKWNELSHKYLLPLLTSHCVLEASASSCSTVRLYLCNVCNLANTSYLHLLNRESCCKVFYFLFEMALDSNQNKDMLTAEDRVNLLLKEGFATACDETTVNPEDKLPDWYDEEKFKRGQKFFHDNIFAMFFAKFQGLLSVLLMPTVLHMLKFTNMSSTEMTAYKRYMATIMHMYVWYTKDFRPGSDLWRSLAEIRSRHFCASHRASKKDMNRISQADMALTQFGFMGFVLSRQKMIGIYYASREELEGFVHVWRVVGHLLGIEDRFNICRESVDETRQICDLIIEKVYAPRLQEAGPDFKQMSTALLRGMTVFNPFLNYPVFITYLHKLCGVEIVENNKQSLFRPLNSIGRAIMCFLELNLQLCQFYVFRKYANFTQYLAIYLTERFPFLAYLKYGYKSGYVSILEKTY